MRRWAGWLLACVLAATLAAACGGGGGGGGATSTGPSTVPVNDWLNSVCTAAGKWQKTLLQTPNVSNPTDLTATKNTISTYLGGVVAATGTFGTEVNAAGVPDTEDGQAIASSFNSSISTLETAFKQAKSDVDGLSTSDSAALVSGLQKVGTELTQAATKLSTDFDTLSKEHPAADLSGAAKDIPACSALTGS